MPKDLERRLRRLERAKSGSRKFAIWYKQGDGTLLGPGGERMTEEAFFSRYPPGTPSVIVFSRTEALL